MKDFQHHCFVCDIPIDPQKATKNKVVNLPLCENCKDTDQEKQAVEDLLDGMADGFVCGCI